MSDEHPRTLTKDDFTVGWICALELELAASKGMLDETYPPLGQEAGDDNIYILGRIAQHNIVLACLPAGTTGITPAAKVATNMLRSFPRIRFGLMVGIAGGAPSTNKSPNEDIRLGDVVVSIPDGQLGGVIKYDRGKTLPGGHFEQTGRLNGPPTQLLYGVNTLRTTHETEKSAISQYVADMIKKQLASSEGNPMFEKLYGYQGWEYDQLYEMGYTHQESAPKGRASSNLGVTIIVVTCVVVLWGISTSSSGLLALCLTMVASALLLRISWDLFYHGSQSRTRLAPQDPKQPCQHCDRSRLVIRHCRATDDPVIHYGTIASADQVMRDAMTRDRLREKYRILCFEMEAAGLMNDFPCLVIRGICDYADSHKHKIWQRYAAATAAAYAKELLQVIPLAEVAKMDIAAEIVQTVKKEMSKVHMKLDPLLDEQGNKKRKEILSWLTPSTQQPQQSDVFSRHQPGTCQWFLESEKFSSWMRHEAQTLFCPGIPGAGKTILASIVIDYLQSQTSSEISVVYLYCSHTLRKEQTAHTLLSTILIQLMEHKPSLIQEHIHSLYSSHKAKGTKPTQKEISSTIFSVLSGFNHTYLVIDALDECSTETCDKLFDEVRRFQQSKRLSVMVTSRPSLEHMFESELRLEIRAQESDIQCYLESEWKKLSICVQRDEIFKESMKKKIVAAADGMFLLATLHFDSLKDKRTPREFERAVKSLPKGFDALNEAYDSAMKRIDCQRENDREWAQLMLSWIVHAVRPLRPDELRQALAVSKEEVRFEDGDYELEESDLPVLEEIFTLCAGLVILNVESNTVQLVHYTTCDYLRCLDWTKNARERVATGCIAYLSLATFKNVDRLSRDELAERIVCNPLYGYAIASWVYHVLISCIEDKPAVKKFLEKKHHVSAYCRALLLLQNGWGDFDGLLGGVTALHLTALQAFGKAILSLLDRNNHPNAIDNAGEISLMWAVHGNRKQKAKLLLRRGADPDLTSEGDNSSLFWASLYGNIYLLNILISHKVNPDLGTKTYGTPLCQAALDGNIRSS